MSVLPYFFRDSKARLLVDESLNVSLKLSSGGRVWLIHVSGNSQTVYYTTVTGRALNSFRGVISVFRWYKNNNNKRMTLNVT